MRSIGIINGFSFVGTSSLFGKEISSILEEFLDLNIDHLGVHKEASQVILKKLCKILDEQLAEICDQNYSSSRYIKYNLMSKEQEIFIDRINSDQKRIMDIDCLILIFRKALISPDSFYYYYLEESNYDYFVKIAKKFKKLKSPSKSNFLDEEYLILIENGLAFTNGNILIPSHKMKNLFFWEY